MTTAEAILNFAAAPHALPSQVRADAERLLADTLAGGAAGAISAEAVKLLGAVRGWGDGEEARLLCGGTATAPSAAFLNGFAIHCLEWDAVHESAVVHALSVVTAALLAASDRKRGSDPEEFLAALAVGVDIASGLGLSATGPMRFFRPATAGVIGAALAVARLEGLSRDQMADVLGLAYSFASGTMQAHVEASVALPLQIGNAARAAISAVDLAKAGLDGPHDVIAGPFGYAALIEDIDLTDYVAGLGQIWRISEVSIKPFPSGRASHGALGALSNMIGEGRLAPKSVARVTLHAPPLIHRLVGRPCTPEMTPAYARLCLPFLVALMLRDIMIDPRRFDAAGLADPGLAALAAKVEVRFDGNPDGNALGPQRIEIELSDGTILEDVIVHNLGSPALPMNVTQEYEKYGLCARLAPDADRRIFNDALAYATLPNTARVERSRDTGLSTSLEASG